MMFAEGWISSVLSMLRQSRMAWKITDTSGIPTQPDGNQRTDLEGYNRRIERIGEDGLRGIQLICRQRTEYQHP